METTIEILAKGIVFASFSTARVISDWREPEPDRMQGSPRSACSSTDKCPKKCIQRA